MTFSFRHRKWFQFRLTLCFLLELALNYYYALERVLLFCLPITQISVKQPSQRCALTDTLQIAPSRLPHIQASVFLFGLISLAWYTLSLAAAGYVV